MTKALRVQDTPTPHVPTTRSWRAAELVVLGQLQVGFPGSERVSVGGVASNQATHQTPFQVAV